MATRDGFTSRPDRDVTRPTTDDLSHLLPGDPVSVLAGTSQSGGNQVVSNEHAMTAPGSAPATPFTSLANETIDHPAPVIASERHPRSVIIGPGGSKTGDHS